MEGFWEVRFRKQSISLLCGVPTIYDGLQILTKAFCLKYWVFPTSCCRCVLESAVDKTVSTVHRGCSAETVPGPDCGTATKLHRGSKEVRRQKLLKRLRSPTCSVLPYIPAQHPLLLGFDWSCSVKTPFVSDFPTKVTNFRREHTPCMPPTSFSIAFLAHFCITFHVLNVLSAWDKHL